MDIISTRQASQRLGVKASTLARAVWDGRIPEPQRGPGGCYLWTPEDIQRAAHAFNVKLQREAVCA